MRGFFEIGIINGKNPINVGTLWRSASQLGASGIFTIGKRYPRQASDTIKAWKHIPYREYDTFQEFQRIAPKDCPIVAVEMGGRSIASFTHPPSCIYLLGAEDDGIPTHVVRRCLHVVSLPSIRTPSYNVAVSGSIVMYDRWAKGGFG